MTNVGNVRFPTSRPTLERRDARPYRGRPTFRRSDVKPKRAAPDVQGVFGGRRSGPAIHPKSGRARRSGDWIRDTLRPIARRDQQLSCESGGCQERLHDHDHPGNDH